MRDPIITELNKMKIIGQLDATQFFESEAAVKVEEDWSGCRSEARARRRHKAGKRQRMIRTEHPACYAVNGVMFCHPEIMEKLREKAKEKSIALNNAIDRMKIEAIHGKFYDGNS